MKTRVWSFFHWHVFECTFIQFEWVDIKNRQKNLNAHHLHRFFAGLNHTTRNQFMTTLIKCWNPFQDYRPFYAYGQGENRSIHVFTTNVPAPIRARSTDRQRCSHCRHKWTTKEETQERKPKTCCAQSERRSTKARIKLHPVVALQDSKFGGQRENSFELLPSSSPATTISKLKLFVFNEINNFYCSSSVSSMGESSKSAPTAVEKIGHPRSKRRSWNCWNSCIQLCFSHPPKPLLPRKLRRNCFWCP